MPLAPMLTAMLTGPALVLTGACVTF